MKLRMDREFWVQFIPHKQQRYDTCGDYEELAPDLTKFSISRLSPVKYSWLIFLHEIIEWSICRLTGVKMAAIDKFDMEYEKARQQYERGERYDSLIGGPLPCRAPCGCPLRDEPGDDPCAPYFHAHQCATLCEKAIARELGIDWEAYDKAVNEL